MLTSSRESDATAVGVEQMLTGHARKFGCFLASKAVSSEVEAHAKWLEEVQKCFCANMRGTALIADICHTVSWRVVAAFCFFVVARGLPPTLDIDQWDPLWRTPHRRPTSISNVLVRSNGKAIERASTKQSRKEPEWQFLFYVCLG